MYGISVKIRDLCTIYVVDALLQNVTSSPHPLYTQLTQKMIVTTESLASITSSYVSALEAESSLSGLSDDERYRCFLQPYMQTTDDMTVSFKFIQIHYNSINSLQFNTIHYNSLQFITIHYNSINPLQFITFHYNSIQFITIH